MKDFKTEVLLSGDFQEKLTNRGDNFSVVFKKLHP